MAHFIVEYSSNMDEAEIALEGLLESLHEAALSTGLFPLKGIRSRAHKCDTYRIADGNPDHAFVHLSVLIGAGREIDDQTQAAETIFSAFQNHFETSFAQRALALSFEMRELSPTLKFNRNNIERYL
ncbi:MAG: 5-carboxymethyl-2-hydroxymuconate Delta-isomerase [Pseudomonadota bacterium]